MNNVFFLAVHGDKYHFKKASVMSMSDTKTGGETVSPAVKIDQVKLQT